MTHAAVRPSAGRSTGAVLHGVAAAMFAASAAATVATCGAMAAMGTMPMPGGWALSMTWTRMSGQ